MRLLLAALFLLSAVPVQAAPVSSRDIYLIDGDTADVGGDRFRLVGYDTPETYKPQCSCEKALGEEATRRARQLVRDAGNSGFHYSARPGQIRQGAGADYSARQRPGRYSHFRWSGSDVIPEAAERDGAAEFQRHVFVVCDRFLLYARF